GTPARERVYADIRTRAATRYPAVTVARIVGEQDAGLVVGSYAVSGAFTREAWERFIQGAIREASNRELQSSDWVLKSVAKDDLMGWFREVVLRQAPTQLDQPARQVADSLGPLPVSGVQTAGPVGREFAGVARLVGVKEKDASLMTGYLDALSKLRTRLNQLK